jgi:P-type Cu+ transporter
LSKHKCDHCSLEFDESALIRDESLDKTLFFCCKGCQGIYHLLKSEGLDSFYDKKANNTLEPPKVSGEDSSRFDLDSFKAKYITEKDGFCEVSLIIDGIHCTACVWLNERVVSRLDGVQEANINFTNNKAKIIWNPRVIKLSRVIEAIRSIGYNAYPYDAKSQEEFANKERRNSYLRLIVGVFATMNMMWIALALYLGYFGGIEQAHMNILHLAEFMLGSLTLFYSGSVFYRGAYYAARNGTVSMDTLVATGASLVYGYSVFAALAGKSEVYFDSVTMIVTFVLAGKYLESLSKKQAVDILDKLGANMPTEALVIRGEEKIFLPLDAVCVGDIIELKAGVAVAIDGEVTSGEADFDESSITGESMPVYKSVGSKLISGSTNNSGLIRYRTTKDYANSNFSIILKLLEESLAKKPSIENFANSLSRYFSLAILSLAALTFALHFWILGVGFDSALITCVSVIVIACPCALALATPIASVVGVAVAAKKGVIFKASSTIETIAKATTLFVDKTGTLTEGKPSVTRVKNFTDYDISLLASLVSASNHPVARGVLSSLEGVKTVQASVSEIKASGLEAHIDGLHCLGGSFAFVSENVREVLEEAVGANFVFAVDSTVVAAFWLSDEIKPRSKETIERIQKMGIKIVMLTGDNGENAKAIADEIGVDAYHHSLKPQDKLHFVEEAQKIGEIVIMTGDGINDTLCLARADVSVSFTNASDISVYTADAILLGSSIGALADAIEVGRTTYKTIKQNIGFSLIYNAITIPVAMSGLVIPPVAAASMSFSSIAVVLNSLRIKRILNG